MIPFCFEYSFTLFKNSVSFFQSPAFSPPAAPSIPSIVSKSGNFKSLKISLNFLSQFIFAKASFATKHVMPDVFGNKLGMLNEKVRLRVSLMPQKYATVLEPNTPLIEFRLAQIDMLLVEGYEVHLNFSPVIVTDGWLEEYRDLFIMIDAILSPMAKKQMKCEVIFLTHNEKKHQFNVENNLPGENLLWVPELQETKTSQYGGVNIRYKHDLKAEYIHQFKCLHDLYIPYCTIRYIF